MLNPIIQKLDDRFSQPDGTWEHRYKLSYKMFKAGDKSSAVQS